MDYNIERQETQQQGSGTTSMDFGLAHLPNTPPFSGSSMATSSAPTAFTLEEVSPDMSDPTENIMPFVGGDNQPYILPELLEASAALPTYGCEPMDLSTNLLDDVDFGLATNFGTLSNFDNVDNMPFSFSDCSGDPQKNDAPAGNLRHGTAPTAVMESSTSSTTDLSALTSMNSGSSLSLPSISSESARSCQCHHHATEILSHATPSVLRQHSFCTSRKSFETVLELGTALEKTISRTSNCACKQDIYLLCTLILAMYKMLEWLEAASSMGKDSVVAPPSTGIDGNVLDGQNVGRVAAQIVLSRLPHVQRTVDCLHEQLQSLDAKAILTPDRKRDSLGQDEANPMVENEPTVPLLPMSLAKALQSTLKSRTLDLAKKVVTQLR